LTYVNARRFAAGDSLGDQDLEAPMRISQHRPDAGAAWRRMAVVFSALFAPTTAIALAHVMETAQRGVICGVTGSGGLDHCWACYAAPMLALAAVASWLRAATAPSPARVRA
jgi:hypothetical protein